MKNIKAVIFDLDNTLLNLTKGAYATFTLFFKENMKDMDPDSIEFQGLIQDAMIWYQNWHGSNKYLFEKINEKYKTNFTYDYFSDYWATQIYKYETPFEKVDETLKYLKAKGYKLGIITNGKVATQTPKITVNGFEKIFDDIIISQAVNTKKPNKEIFDISVNNLGVKNEEAIYVGDIYSGDVIGAVNAGLKAIWFCQNPYIGNDNKVARIYKFEDLMEIL